MVGNTSKFPTSASRTRPRVCPGAFTKKGTGAICVDVRGGDLAPVLHADLERVAVVGHHHHEGGTKELHPAQAPDEGADLPVHEPHLEQVAQMVVIGEVAVGEAVGPVDRADGVDAGRSHRPARGQVDPGLVGEQRVMHVERRALARLDGGDPSLESQRSLRPAQLAEHVGRASGLGRAHRGRADRGHRLVGHHAVAEPGQEREDAVRVPGVTRLGALARRPCRRGWPAPPWSWSRTRRGLPGTRWRCGPARRIRGSGRSRSPHRAG